MTQKQQPAGTGGSARAVVVPGWTDSPGTGVHLAQLKSRNPDGWSTVCPANVAGLPLNSDQWRALVPVSEPIDCPECIDADPELVETVNLLSQVTKARRVRAARDVLAFLRFLREELGVTLADRPDGVQLKAYPSGMDESFVAQWLSVRPVAD